MKGRGEQQDGRELAWHREKQQCEISRGDVAEGFLTTEGPKCDFRLFALWLTMWLLPRIPTSSVMSATLKCFL